MMCIHHVVLRMSLSGDVLQSDRDDVVIVAFIIDGVAQLEKVDRDAVLKDKEGLTFKASRH